MRRGPRRPSEPELMGASEAAKELGVAQSNLRTVRDLPQSYQPNEKGGEQVAATTLWRAEEIRALAAKRRPREAAA